MAHIRIENSREPVGFHQCWHLSPSCRVTQSKLMLLSKIVDGRIWFDFCFDKESWIFCTSSSTSASMDNWTCGLIGLQGSQKCLNVRQKLGTRNVLKTWRLENFENMKNDPCKEQLLFSCLCSKVTVYCRKLQCFFWTATAPYPVILEFLELVPS